MEPYKSTYCYNSLMPSPPLLLHIPAARRLAITRFVPRAVRSVPVAPATVHFASQGAASHSGAVGFSNGNSTPTVSTAQAAPPKPSRTRLVQHHMGKLQNCPQPF